MRSLITSIKKPVESPLHTLVGCYGGIVASEEEGCLLVSQWGAPFSKINRWTVSHYHIVLAGAEQSKGLVGSSRALFRA